MAQSQYTEENIRSLDWKEHIRMRPGMYIGKLGDGSSADDGIYILLKEVIDNCIDEFVMGAGKTIEITIREDKVTVRDYGRGIPLGKVVEVVSKMNTGGKYDTRAFKKAVGLNGVGTKAVNALSTYFRVESNRDGKSKAAEFETGDLKNEEFLEETSRKRGTKVTFTPDETIFKKYKYRSEYVERMLRNYVYLNPGLTIVFNGEKFHSENGLKDLLQDNNSADDLLYPIIHLKGEDIEVALTHSKTQYSEEYHSFVNGQHTTQGGTHQSAFREALVKTLRDFYGKNYDPSDVRKSVISAISIKVMEPVFESQTKTKLGSTDMGGNLPTVRTYINDFVGRELDNYLHKNPQTAELIQRKIQQAERERKELSGIRKLARERAKKASLHNKKLRDCRVHLDNMKNDRRLETTLFITEGDSASGSITKSRDVNTQAVFSLRGKPLNSYGMSKKIVYENEEFNLLQAALNIEESLEDLRYNNIVIATDADVDGMHIRLLLITFFLQFFPEIIKEGHLYILQTPLFRVRNKKETIYCYSEEEKREAVKKLKGKPEITRFKGLGEISPDEFQHFIGEDIRLEPVMLDKAMSIEELLKFYMGKNTPDRQEFIIENLKVEVDLVEENQL
ncbi:MULTISPECIES: DNA topoisomerase IV subunit B [Robiginitalea]|uniref:DNA topoisomerase (ATP-hydrolyzing) n=1 Tax=Robiginitalea biformata (strain ATCC BAA-864 / DSM 15991 / KCTC 12146 / HTCC2501) TaxID=313596 RepID=A4CLG0_ROBBH|nr:MULTISPECIES: DNA topoisomerase IV subunit B [Robiginitalea]EAR15709.1 DNA topoisomerase IV subunit B [Robiginitalea biformata HTCC2501]MDC6354138.1 DNA topoisomerase IV subunit B [Robiginitalea sp. PM2]MDC6374405.1 DNA topoisomerase IV subunit B [Robiginitalea sp. SP8]